MLETGEATWDESLLLFLERSGYPEETYHTFSYSPLANDDGAIVGMLCVVMEETDRIVGERRLLSLRELASEMAGKNTAVFGIFSTRGAVEDSLVTLKEAGFRNEDVSVLLPENLGSKDLATEKSTKAPEGAAAGAGSGAVIGGALGWLVGIGTLAIPGLGPFIATGPIMAALAGIGVGGAVGGFAGALVGMGIPEYEAKRYEGRLQKGGILLSVHCDTSDEIKRAKQIIEATGGEDVSSTGEASTGTATSDREVDRTVKYGSN